MANHVAAQLKSDFRFQAPAAELMQAWPRFVHCAGRMKTLGPYLEKFLPLSPDVQILDAAAGTGCEVLWLARKGLSVTANEISHDLRQQLVRKLEIRGPILTAFDWNDFADSFPRPFDGVVLLGNSMCLMPTSRMRRRVLSNIRKVTKRGGKLFIDQRNFSRIRNERVAVRCGTFRFHQDVMYTGGDITAYPVRVSRSQITLGYFDEKHQKTLGYWTMYSFDEFDLAKEIADSGFLIIDTSYDLGLRSRESCDFITHTAIAV